MKTKRTTNKSMDKCSANQRKLRDLELIETLSAPELNKDRGAIGWGRAMKSVGEIGANIVSIALM